MKNIYNNIENRNLIKELKKELEQQQVLYEDTDPNESKHEFFHGIQ